MDDEKTLFISTDAAETEVEISYNIANPDMTGDDPIYLAIREPGWNKTSCALSVEQATTLRDHLTLLIGGPEPVVAEPVISERAVEAMEELAHQLSVFSTHDLTDALNGFNK